MTTEEELPKSIIVHIDRFSLSKDLQLNAFQEFKELCVASGTEVCAEIAGKIDRPSPTYFVIPVSYKHLRAHETLLDRV